jgi:hypothetical protein
MRFATLAPAAAIMAATGLMVINSSAQAPAPAGETAPEGISSVRADPGQGRSSAWSAARMREAQPITLPVADPEAVRSAYKARGAGPPASGATQEGKPAPGLGRRSGNVRSFPLTQVGRLYFNAPGDKPGWGHTCTAQFIAQNIILTAAHCVQDDTPPYAYHTNYLFSLEYEQGAAKRRYGWKCQANMKAWAQQSPARYLFDYAMIQTDGASEVGWFGLQWNWMGTYNRATKIGYPSGSFKGEVIQVDAGPLSVRDGLVELNHGNKDVQHGSSGGGYVGDYSTNPNGNANHIISSESFSRGEAGETSGIGYGPYYTEQIFTLFNYTKAGCKNP